MSDETIGENLGNLSENARISQEAFQDIGSTIREIKKTTGDTSDLFRNLTREISRGYKDSEKLAEAVERVKNGTASTKTLQRQAGDQIARANTLADKADQLQQKAANSTGMLKVNLSKAAMAAGDAAREAEILAKGFANAAAFNEKLN